MARYFAMARRRVVIRQSIPNNRMCCVLAAIVAKKAYSAVPCSVLVAVKVVWLRQCTHRIFKALATSRYSLLSLIQCIAQIYSLNRLVILQAVAQQSFAERAVFAN